MTDTVTTSTITVQQVLTDDGTETWLDIEPPDTPLIEVLGALRLAEDTAIRMHMGDDEPNE